MDKRCITAGNVRQVQQPSQVRLACVRGRRGRLFRFDSLDSMTYAGYVGLVLDRHMLTGQVPVVRVQVRKRGVMFCGRVLEAAPAREGQDTDWFKVDWQLGQDWFPHGNVRQCSGLDGRCLCDEAPESLRVCAQAPGASTVPPGNTGTTVGVGA